MGLDFVKDLGPDVVEGVGATYDNVAKEALSNDKGPLSFVTGDTYSTL